MGGRDVDHTIGPQRGAVDTFCVHRHTLHLCASNGEGVTGGAVAGIFNRYAISRPHQQLCTKADCLLRATGDHYLRSAAPQAPGVAQVGGNQAPQALIAGRVAIAQLLQVRLAPESRIQLGPHVKREQVKCRHAHPKSPGRSTGRQG